MSTVLRGLAVGGTTLAVLGLGVAAGVADYPVLPDAGRHDRGAHEGRHAGRGHVRTGDGHPLRRQGGPQADGHAGRGHGGASRAP